MRVTYDMYYNNLYGNENSKLSNKLFDVNKQIASGLKIQYASDDVSVYTETMRLDNEMATLTQAKKSSQSGYTVADQTDTVMNEYSDLMNRFRTLLVQAANDTNDETSRDSISKELRGIEKNLKSLANTSINGKYLFSGSALDVKPINDDGTYNGNDKALKSFVGSNNQLQYNIPGSDLFLGEESSVKREITTNVVNSNLLTDGSLKPESQIRDLMGDKNNTSPNTAVFYVRGVKSDGTAFKEKLNLSDTATIDTLLNNIENIYGDNTVNVSMNGSGEIVVEDKIKGSSKLDFHMVGAIDYTDGTTGLADVDDIDGLDGGETTYPPNGDLYIKEFNKSGLSSADGAASIEGLIYDRTEFSKDGVYLTSNAPQVLNNGNEFATASTKLSEVSSGSLNGTSFKMTGFDTSGKAYSATIDLDGDSTFIVDYDNDGDGTLDGNPQTYDIFNMDTTRVGVDADEMTYQQLTDVMNMIVTNSTPNANDATSYDDAITLANTKGKMELTYDGKIKFQDIRESETKATIALYDVNSDNFTKAASNMRFNLNNSLTIRDPKTDFFKDIDEMIVAVENYNNYPDANSSAVRSIGIQGAISKMDDLQDHVFRVHSTSGAQSNTLSKSVERLGILEVTTMSLRSSVIDTDLAEASLELTQLTNNYEAMLSTVGRVSKLSLVNYL
jgi:flagellar hook-associated protein 3 FlgL